jgi:hypothetical protein
MNIFYLDPDPKTCAEMHLDKHVVKMIIEYCQLMSTAHRVLDGDEYYDKSINGRKVQRWRLSDERETLLMKPTMMKHPSAIWVRANDENYRWLFAMWTYLCQEYTFRYGKQHACSRLLTSLDKLPFNITTGVFFPPTPAMPDDCKVLGDSLASYHKYYIEKKVSFAKWTKREVPLWFQNGINKNNANLQLL